MDTLFNMEFCLLDIAEFSIEVKERSPGYSGDLVTCWKDEGRKGKKAKREREKGIKSRERKGKKAERKGKKAKRERKE